MAYITNKILPVCSRILLSRLTSYFSGPANILTPDELVRSNLDEHFGRYLGFFSKQANNNIVFALFSRPDFDQYPETVHVFYLNSNNRCIQPKESKLIKNFAPNFKISGSNCAIINVESCIDPIYNLGIILSALELNIGPRIDVEFRPNYVIKLGNSRMSMRSMSILPSPDCEITSHLLHL